MVNKGQNRNERKMGQQVLFFIGGHTNFNLFLRFSLLPVEGPWLGLVTCLQESGKLQRNDWGRGGRQM